MAANLFVRNLILCSFVCMNVLPWSEARPASDKNETLPRTSASSPIESPFAAQQQHSTLTARHNLRHLSSTNLAKRSYLPETHFGFGNNNTVSSTSVNEIQSQIIGGVAVDSPNAFPFFVSVGSGATVLCGGSLVAPDVFLTAAHCTGAYPVGGNALIGAWELMTQIAGHSYQVEITQVLPYPTFVQYHNDIMLVKFSPPVTSLPTVKLNFNTNFPYANQPMTIMGFGQTTDSYGYVHQLRSALVYEVPYSTCVAIYPNIIEGQHICVENTAPLHITCAGDSGGPLVWGSGNLEIGVLSFGAQTCTDGPSVFTRTSYYQSWLTSSICSLSDFNPAGSITCQR